MARDKPVIWVRRKQRYFCKQGSTREADKRPSGKSGVEEDDARASADQAVKPDNMGHSSALRGIHFAREPDFLLIRY
jgi:hypothetical protein